MSALAGGEVQACALVRALEGELAEAHMELARLREALALKEAALARLTAACLEACHLLRQEQDEAAPRGGPYHHGKPLGGGDPIK